MLTARIPHCKNALKQDYVIRARLIIRERTPTSTRGTMGELFAAWLALQGHRCAAGKLSESTLDWYRGGIDAHLQFFKGIPTSEVTAAHLQQFIDGKGKGLGKSSVRRLTIILKAVMAYALEEGYITKNPASRLELSKVETVAHERVWTFAQVQRFLEATQGTPLGPLWWLLAVTGVRRGEALGLRWDDLAVPDIGAASIEIRRAYINVRGPVMAGTKTAKSARRFTIDPITTETMLRLRTTQQEAYGHDWATTWPIFMRPDLNPLNPNYVTRDFQETAKSLGRPPIGPHGLRHSLATALGEERVPLLTVSRLLGHSSTRATADIYSHVFAETAGEAVATAARRLRPA